MASADVVVIGAGAAGLAAAVALREAGCRAVVIEARDRLGGRIWTAPVSELGAPVELGAEWLHGEAQATHALAREAGARVVPASGVPLRADAGRISSGASFWAEVAQLSSQLDPCRAPDRSVGEAIDALARNERARAEARRYVEGFHAADVAIASERAVARAEREESGTGAQHRIVPGYGAITAALAARLDPRAIRTGTRARSVRWSRGAVAVECESRARARDTVRAGAAIVALPLGVLSARDVVIEPEPPRLRRALDALEPGHVVRVTLALRRPLPDLIGRPDVGFVFAEDEPLSVWWTPQAIDAPLLVGWRGGPRARALLARGAAVVHAQARESLRRALGWTARDAALNVEHAWAHDWTHDPLARGAYAYVRVGGVEAVDALDAPIDGTLAFAGEHLAGAGIGTVEGAIASGRHAARAVLASLAGSGASVEMR